MAWLRFPETLLPLIVLITCVEAKNELPFISNLLRHGKSHFVIFLALKSPGPYHRYFKLWQGETGFLPRLGQKPRPPRPMASANMEFETSLKFPSTSLNAIPLRFISLSANASSTSHTS